MLGGLIAGVTVSGVLMAIFQANAGGAWDNAKKCLKKVLKLMDKCTIKVLMLIKPQLLAIQLVILLKIHPAHR